MTITYNADAVRANEPTTIPISGTSMSEFLDSLPTSPPIGGGWWNNGGIPTES